MTYAPSHFQDSGVFIHSLLTDIGVNGEVNTPLCIILCDAIICSFVSVSPLLRNDTNITTAQVKHVFVWLTVGSGLWMQTHEMSVCFSKD